jgi:hypothetical protein
MRAITCSPGKGGWPGSSQEADSSDFGASFREEARFYGGNCISMFESHDTGRSLWGFIQDPHACACLPVLDPVQRVCSLARTRARLSVPCTLSYSSCSTDNISGSDSVIQKSVAYLAQTTQRLHPKLKCKRPQVPTGQTVCLAYLASAQPVLGNHRFVLQR